MAERDNCKEHKKRGDEVKEKNATHTTTKKERRFFDQFTDVEKRSMGVRSCSSGLIGDHGSLEDFL
jgi:hypothetical protein